MASRLELHEILCRKLGSRNVYFDPPESIKMVYPCITYELEDVNSLKADDDSYVNHRRYEIKYISRNPDNDMIDSLLQLKYCSYDRRFVSDNLYHDCFDLYY